MLGVTEEDKRKYRAWEYPLKKWPREETFWREMTTRTLSTLVAALVIAIVALVAGAWTPDQRVQVITATVASVGGLIVLAVIAVLLLLLWDHLGPRRTHYFPSKGGVSFGIGQGYLKKQFRLSSNADPENIPEFEIYRDRVFARYAEIMNDPGKRYSTVGINYRDLPAD